MEVEQPMIKEELMNVAETTGANRVIEEEQYVQKQEKRDDQIKRARLGQAVISSFPKINDPEINPVTITQELLFRGINFNRTDTKAPLVKIIEETVNNTLGQINLMIKLKVND